MHSTEPSAWSHEAPHREEHRGLRGHLSRGLHLTWTSLRVLSKDPNLLVLPLLALVLNAFVWLVVFVSFWILGFPPWSPASPFLYQEMFVAYLVSCFLSVYFMAAIIGAAYARLDGRKPLASEGIRLANARILRLLAWSLVSATAGVLFRLGALRSEAAGKAIRGVLGASWSVATLFVLPAIVLEDVGPVKAFRRSRTLRKERWGRDQSGVLGTGAVFGVLFLFGFVPFLLGFAGDGGSAFLWLFGAVLYWLLLAALWSLVHGILVTALYHYATSSEASLGFKWQALNHPWVR